jgi:spermidine synthase
MPKKVSLPTDWIIFSIITLGIAEILTQLVVVREFLAVFYGNELVIGILLANWLLISGVGSYIGRHVSRIADKQRIVIILHVVMAFLLLAYVYVIRNLYNFAFIRGELVSVTSIFFTAFFILLPVCLVTGFSLPLFSVLYSKRQKPRQIGSVYVLDSLSNIIGGLLFSFVLIYFLNAFQVALLVLVINLAAAIVLCTKTRRVLVAYVLFLVLVLAAIFLVKFDLNAVTARQQFTGQDVVALADSVYGRVVMTRTEDQLNFFENGMLLFSTDDNKTNEEKVHYTMFQRPEADKVLLISGGVSGTALEVLKYNVSVVDYVELDPVVIGIGDAFTKNLADPRIRVYNMDARMFVRQVRDRYDVVIIDLPDPSTAMLNRFYTEEFFLELRKVLERGAVVGLSISSGANYLSDETKQLDSAVFNALDSKFTSIMVLPGDEAYLIASDGKLSYSNYLEPPVETVFVNKDYMHDRLDKKRVADFYSAVEESSVTNRDFRPVAYYYHLIYWLKHFETNYWVFLTALLVFLVWVLWRIRPVTFAVMSAGFAGISLELVLIVGFQIIYGHVYHMIGLIITSFMVGLALGARYANSRIAQLDKRSVCWICFAIAGYSILLPLLLFALRGAAGSAAQAFISTILFPVLTAIIAALVGALFPVASKLHFRKVAGTASSLYFYDYAGACIGALLVSVLLIPLLGIFWVCAIIAVLTLVAGIVVMSK